MIQLFSFYCQINFSIRPGPLLRPHIPRCMTITVQEWELGDFIPHIEHILLKLISSWYKQRHLARRRNKTKTVMLQSTLAVCKSFSAVTNRRPLHTQRQFIKKRRRHWIIFILQWILKKHSLEWIHQHVKVEHEKAQMKSISYTVHVLYYMLCHR